MNAVRQISTGRIIHREFYDFVEGNGIKEALVFYPNLEEGDLEECNATLAEWEAELESRKEGELPHSEHIAKLISVTPANAKPAVVRRKYMGDTFDISCLVTQSVADLYQTGDIQVNDYVLVSFIDEIPDTEEKHLAIITAKIFESW